RVYGTAVARGFYSGKPAQTRNLVAVLPGRTAVSLGTGRSVPRSAVVVSQSPDAFRLRDAGAICLRTARADMARRSLRATDCGDRDIFNAPGRAQPETVALEKNSRWTIARRFARARPARHVHRAF